VPLLRTDPAFLPVNPVNSVPRAPVVSETLDSGMLVLVSQELAFYVVLVRLPQVVHRELAVRRGQHPFPTFNEQAVDRAEEILVAVRVVALSLVVSRRTKADRRDHFFPDAANLLNGLSHVHRVQPIQKARAHYRPKLLVPERQV